MSSFILLNNRNLIEGKTTINKQKKNEIIH